MKVLLKFVWEQGPEAACCEHDNNPSDPITARKFLSHFDMYQLLNDDFLGVVAHFCN